MQHKIDRLSLDDISRCLNESGRATSDLPNAPLQAESFVDAAVLAPFLRIDDAWHLLYIRRSRHERDFHSGQVAFAGGKKEPQDASLVETAKREAWEEIGLLGDDVEVLGQLEPHHSISRFRITPVVAHVPWPYSLELDKREVARAFTIPLAWLAMPENHSIQPYQASASRSFPVVEFREFDGERLWGATARMTLSLLSLLER